MIFTLLVQDICVCVCVCVRDCVFDHHVMYLLYPCGLFSLLEIKSNLSVICIYDLGIIKNKINKNF